MTVAVSPTEPACAPGRPSHPSPPADPGGTAAHPVTRAYPGTGDRFSVEQLIEFLPHLDLDIAVVARPGAQPVRRVEPPE